MSEGITLQNAYYHSMKKATFGSLVHVTSLLKYRTITLSFCT